jgi:hypothetical protein
MRMRYRSGYLSSSKPEREAFVSPCGLLSWVASFDLPAVGPALTIFSPPQAALPIPGMRIMPALPAQMNHPAVRPPGGDLVLIQ